MKYNWSRLNRLQLSRYAEYLVKMQFTLYGFDVYGSEVDDRGIDLVVRKEQNVYYDIQVKSARLPVETTSSSLNISSNYVKDCLQQLFFSLMESHPNFISYHP